jgi:hypothetical protein
MNNWNASASQVTGNIAGDPLLVNPASEDFRLCTAVGQPSASCAGSSIAIDAGVNVGLPYNGTAPDIGALESGVSATPTPTPTPTSLVIPGRIEAESYNAGGQNVGYFDTTAGNFGDYTGRGDDVDIKNTADGPTVGYTANGEWLAYAVNVQSSGTYTPTLRVANGMTTNGSVHLELNGSNITGPIAVPPTGSWDTQTTITGPTLNLTQGTHTLKVVFDVTPIDLNWMEFM